MDEQLYFAYGSNINLEQMAVRCPAATPVCPVALDNYRLAFRGAPDTSAWQPLSPPRARRSTACCGRSPRPAKCFDRYEGYPRPTGRNRSPCGQERPTVSRHGVHHGAEFCLDPAEPHQGYLTGIVQGCKQSSIPVGRCSRRRAPASRRWRTRPG